MWPSRSSGIGRVGALCLLLGAPAWAGEGAPVGAVQLDQATLDTAESLFFGGLAHYRAGRFEKAAVAFQQAYVLTEHRDMLYNIARSREQLGDLLAAVDWYRAYLNSKPADETAVIHRIRQLGGDPTPKAAPRLRKTPKGDEGPLIVRTGAGPWPWVALGVGVVAFGAGTAFGMQALDSADSARGAELRSVAQTHKSDAESKALIADLAFGAGAAAIGAAVYLWLEADAAADSPSGHMQLQAGATGAKIGYVVPF